MELYKKYIIDISDLKDPDRFRHGYHQITRERQKKVDAMRIDQSKRQSLGAGLAMVKAFAEWGISKDQVISYSKNGKPKLADYDHIWFNLSHSEERVLCVMADHPIGCDVERIREAHVKVAKRIFNEKEYSEFERRSDIEEAAEFFYRIWTRKESVSKAFGCGMAVPFQNIEVWPEADEKQLQRIMKEYLKEERIPEDFSCRFEELRQDGYQYCICHLDRKCL